MPANWDFFRRRRSRADADAVRLVQVVIQAARRPGFFGAGKAPDTLEGRLELLMLHGALALLRLKRDPALEPLGQAFVDRLFGHVDAGLREAGVGDTAVPKRMRKIAGDFYGRVSAYEAARAGGGLAATIGRNVLGDEAAPFAAALADYVETSFGALEAAEPEALFALSTWPAAPG
jgi:cytochrome b pre-mRNA-processing protein 3